MNTLMRYKQFLETYHSEEFTSENFQVRGDIDEGLIFYHMDKETNTWKLFNGILKDTIETDGHTITKKARYSFYKNGLVHRLNGPAKVLYDVDKLDSLPTSHLWYINGDPFFVSADITDFYETHGIDINNITPEDEFLIQTKFGRIE